MLVRGDSSFNDTKKKKKVEFSPKGKQKLRLLEKTAS